MIDTLQRFLPAILGNPHNTGGGAAYGVVTLHRAANVDTGTQLKSAVGIIEKAADLIPIVFPVHPRTRNRLILHDLLSRLVGNSRIKLTDPSGYVEFLTLVKNAALVLTDSGGVQVETSVLQVPCLTMRENTEWSITVENGTNELVGFSEEKILHCVKLILDGRWKQGTMNTFCDGRAAERCIDAILSA